MTAIARVRYEGSSLNLNSVEDSDGDQFDFVDVEGLDGMEAELELIDGYGVGSTFGAGRYPRRELLIKGRAIGNRPEEGSVFRAMRKVENWFADVDWNQRWLYFDLNSPGVSVQLKVVPGGKLSFSTPKGNMCEFEVPFTALDPRKYGQTLYQPIVHDETVTLTNGGNFPTFVFATLLTSANDVWVEINGSRITLPGNMPVNTTIDFLKRQTTYPTLGIRDLAALPRPWAPLLPGANTVTTNGRWRLDYRDAWR